MNGRDTSVQPELINRRTGESRPVCVDCGEPFEREPMEVAARRGTGLALSPQANSRESDRTLLVRFTLPNASIPPSARIASAQSGCRSNPG
jgi:hypothetical protein